MTTNTDNSYDLFKRRKDHVTETMLVITPYVEASFFETLIREANPEKLVVVVDDGCRREDLEVIRNAVKRAGSKRQPKEIITVLGSAPGLVHIKLFYTVSRSQSGRHSRSLIFGSANATKQGFSGSSNAELKPAAFNLRHIRQP